MYPGYALYLERRGDLPPRLFRLVPASVTRKIVLADFAGSGKHSGMMKSAAASSNFTEPSSVPRHFSAEASAGQPFGG